MEQYISKSALVAEIENLLKPVRQRLERDKNDPWDSDIAVYKFGKQLTKNIDTLEVKEVEEEPVSEDFEKIVEEIVEPTILNAYGAKELARRLRNTICDTSVSNDLEEAAEKYAYKEFPSVGVANTEAELAFKAGAKWQKEKDQKR